MALEFMQFLVRFKRWRMYLRHKPTHRDDKKRKKGDSQASRHWLTAKPNAALRFDKSTDNGFSQCRCAWANPCKFITTRWNNFMRVPQVQNFPPFIPIFWWQRLDEEGNSARFEIPRVSSQQSPRGASDNCVPLIPFLQNMWPSAVEYSGPWQCVSRGPTGFVWLGFHR